MKKIIAFLCITIYTGIALFAQDELRARMELENAEKAYNESRYADALKHLDKTQASLGKWSHQISYLRILSLDKLCDYGDMQSAYFQQLQQEVAQYLDYNRANAGKAVMEKVREVYTVEEHINSELRAQEAWAKVDQTSQTDLQGYLASYPHSAKASNVRNLLDNMQKQESDQQRRETWEQIKDTEDKVVLERFIRDYQGSAEAQMAADRLLLALNLEMIFVQGGTFTMENPPHQVTLSDFYIGKYEVTQALWEYVTGITMERHLDKYEPDWRKLGMDTGNGNHPMFYVNWPDAVEFLEKLNKLTGKKFRLPTEAEWEYAARGGAKSKGYKYSGSDNIDDVASYKKRLEVGSKKPNELGIYDMSGNVYEWCYDWFDKLTATSQTDPKGPSSGTAHVLRGGCWYDFSKKFLRTTFRPIPPTDKSGRTTNYGFRLAMDAE